MNRINHVTDTVDECIASKPEITSTTTSVAADRRLLLRLKYRAATMFDDQLLHERIQAKLKEEKDAYLQDL